MASNKASSPLRSQQAAVWEFIAEKKAKGIHVILLYVLERKGSSPGRRGFKMAVAADNSFCGTIGGGIMEHKFVEMARANLNQHSETDLVYKQIHDKTSGKNQSGMICSGEQTIFLHEIHESELHSIKNLIASLQSGENGTLRLSARGVDFHAVPAPSNFQFTQQGEEFMLVEKTGYRNIVHIIGGGHCALAFSKLMNDLDFYVCVYDEREDLNTMNQNSYAHEKKIISSYADIGDMIESGEHVYVVIMTFGYRTDDVAFRALIGKEFRYLGILGSKNKIQKMFSDYRKENVSESLLAKIHAPVGLQIKSQTTAEIAVSIAAEIIAVKNKDQ